jgi:acyl carrier protein
VGVPGELCVGGVGLARGYLDRPELTAERFVPNPFGEAGSRLYRSGDLCRFLPSGEIEFLGRIDHQVKVRGFRIELGEIESVMATHPSVRDVAVVVREDVPGDSRIVAYVVPGEGAQPGPQELRAHLRRTLPEYMLPSVFILLDAMPLSASGKIDRRALPAPGPERADPGRATVAPRNDVEAKLVAICQNLLGTQQVGVYDSFFDLGGHSLMVTQFLARIREEFHQELPVRTVFEHPTVAELAAYVGTAGTEAPPELQTIAEVLDRVNQKSEAEALKYLNEAQVR